MPFATTYRQSKERAGRLTHWLTFYTPVLSRTAAGGQRTSWLEWREVKGMVEAQRGSEQVEADRPTAVNSKRFTVRTLSVPDINETMMLVHDGQQYHIERIDTLDDQPRNAWKEITATRRATNVTPVEFLSNQMYMDWSQRFTNITAAYVTVTAGNLLDTDDYTEAEINQLLFVFRGGLRLTYGSTADDGFTITSATNRITPNLALAGENLLVHQYRTT